MIDQQEYLCLRRDHNAPHAIPTMAYLGVKYDRNYNTYRAKIRIVVLRNQKNRAFNKSWCFAPVLSYPSLRLLTSKVTEKRRILQQGDCKNAFCNALLPDDKITIVCPPLSNTESVPDDFWLLNKTLYGLRRSPQHQYNLITKILSNMGLTPSNHDPCLFSGVINNGTLPLTPQNQTHVGLHANDFISFTESNSEESCFKCLLNDKVTTDFMGDANFFLGSSFEWNRRPGGHLSVHVSQQAFVEHASSCFRIKDCNWVPLMTPYRSGCPNQFHPLPGLIRPQPPGAQSHLPVHLRFH